MIRQIIRKELLVNILSMRFMAGLVVSALMMGIVGYVLIEDYAARVQKYIADVQEHREALAQTKVYSMVAIVVDIPPSPLSVFSRGSQDLPTSVRVSPYHVPSAADEAGEGATISLHGTGSRPSNPLLRMFSSIDLTFVISTILSLFAVILVFDSFSGELEQGTLKMLLSASAGRAQLYAGKFLGALVSLAIPLTVGFLEVIVLWTIHPGLALDARAWADAGLVYLCSLLFLSSFLALALLIALYARESSSCLMTLLLAWVGVAVVIPAGGEYLAEGTRPVSARENLLAAEARSKADFEKTVEGIDYRQIGGWNNASTDQFEGESLLGITAEEVQNRLAYNLKVFPLKFRFAEDHYSAVEAYGQELRSWRGVRENMIRPSLCVQYSNLVSALAGTDAAAFEETVVRARRYRDALMSFLQPRVESPRWFTRALDYPDVQPTEANRAYWQSLIDHQGERAVERILSWDRVAPVDLAGLPTPVLAPPGAGERAERAMPDLLLLFACCGLCCTLGIIRVRRYPLN